MPRVDLYRSKGDGGEQPVSEEFLDELKEEVDCIANDLERGIWVSRTESENTRLCKWQGQSSDGRKHAEANDDEPVMPFEGACDQRIRLADMLVNEDVMLCVLASIRADIGVTGTEAEDTSRAGNISILLRYIIRNMLGIEWIKELMLCANYMFADSPAVALMSVKWRRQDQLALKQITIDEMLQLYIDLVMQNYAEADAGVTEEEYLELANNAVEEFLMTFQDPNMDVDAMAELLIQFFGFLKPSRAKKVIRELTKDGVATFPVPYVKYDGPEVSAKRYLKEFYIPSNTIDYQRARVCFEPEWLTKAEVRQRQIEDGWNDEFVEQLIGSDTDGNEEGKEGMVAFKEYEWDSNGELVEATEDTYKGLYQIVTAYFTATNDDGIPGRYYVQFHPDIDVAATDKRLLSYDHGKFPGHLFQREVMTRRVLDSRGLAELSSTHQDQLKLFADSFGDCAQISGVPPIVTRGRRGQGRLYIEPLMELQAKRDGDYQWLNPPQYPQNVDQMIAETRRQTDEYFGRANEEVADEIVQMHREFKVMWWLANLKEVMTQILQLAQQYMTDEMVQRITNSQEQPLFRDRSEIQGQFDINLSFDPRDFDPEYLSQLGTTIRDVLMSMDREQVLNATPVVESLMWRLAPNLAAQSVRDVDTARKSELEDEWDNYLMILAGREPPMIDDGSQNYEIRLNMYQGLQDANPAVFQSLPEDRMAILQARIQHLQVMSEQYGENKEIGRQGTRSALGSGGTQEQ